MGGLRNDVMGRPSEAPEEQEDQRTEAEPGSGQGAGR